MKAMLGVLAVAAIICCEPSWTAQARAAEQRAMLTSGADHDAADTDDAPAQAELASR